MAGPDTLDVVTGAGVALLFVDRVFGFLKPIIQNALEGKGNPHNKITLAVLGVHLSNQGDKLDTVIENQDEMRGRLGNLEKQFEVHLAVHEKTT